MTLSDLLTGTNETTLTGSAGDLLETGVNILYSVFNFVVAFVTNNASILVLIIAIGLVFGLARYFWKKAHVHGIR